MKVEPTRILCTILKSINCGAYCKDLLTCICDRSFVAHPAFDTTNRYPSEVLETIRSSIIPPCSLQCKQGQYTLVVF